MKIRYVLIPLLLVILLVTISIQYSSYQKNKGLLIEGLRLIKNESFEAGLDRCDLMSYHRGICYELAWGVMLHNIQTKNMSVSRDFCSRIPVYSKDPFWVIRYKLPEDIWPKSLGETLTTENYRRNLIWIKKSCLLATRNSVS